MVDLEPLKLSNLRDSSGFLPREVQSKGPTCADDALL